MMKANSVNSIFLPLNLLLTTQPIPALHLTQNLRPLRRGTVGTKTRARVNL